MRIILWHVCFQADELEDVQSFAKDSLQWDDEKCKLLLRVWTSIPQGYAMLSLKAIRNINRMLCRGLKYSDAVMLAKVPEIAGMNENEIDTLIETFSKDLKTEVDRTKDIYIITNSLIADYKSLSFEDRFAEHDTSYCLQESDKEDIVQHIIKHFGEVTWGLMDAEEQETLMDEVEQLYQNFFSKTKRNFYDIPTYASTLRAFLCEKFPHVDEQAWAKLYHPSQIASYHPERDKNCPDSWRLGTPNIGAIRNPVALRTLNILRRKINALLDANMIDPLETRVVVETTRTLNDANMRWAIDRFQKKREEQNKIIRSILEKEYTTRAISETDINTARYILEQREEHIYQTEKTGELQHDFSFNIDTKRYKLWLEQGGICFYTGKVINLTNIFNDNAFDIEHTLPRSKSFDNSDANLTICDAHYNRYIKKNILPAHLPNFEHDQTINGTLYTAIKPRLEMWRKRVERLKVNVDFWKNRTRRAQDKDTRDKCIRQRHLWQMELNYWHEKLSHFEMEEIKEGFRNSQLVDTGIITRHAALFLKSLFKNVEVQKGSVTADFRKILGIQSVNEAKNRDKHSHHAIDATILTTIPIAAKRDRMLEIFLRIKELKKILCFSKDTNKQQEIISLNQKLQYEINSCHLGNDIASLPSYIENNIIIRHLRKEQTQQNSRRTIRIRGKKIYVTDHHGNKHKKWSSGDSIRGELSGQSFYGAITQWKEKTNRNETTNHKEQNIIDPTIYYVIRKPLVFKNNTSAPGFSSWEDLEKQIVNKALIPMMKSQFCEGTSFKEACGQPIYMLNRKGEKINVLRHIRCYVRIKNPIAVKKHTFLSSKPYKQNVYAGVGGLYAAAEYTNGNKRQFVIYSLKDIAQNKKKNNEIIPSKILNGTKTLTLQRLLHAKDSILIYEESPEELKKLSMTELSKRLYVIKGFEAAKTRIKAVNHLYNIDEIGETITDYQNLPITIRLSLNKLKFLLHGYDFKFTTSGLEFLDK